MRNKTVRICAFLCILLFTAAAVAVIFQYSSKTPNEIEITVDGKTIYRGASKTDGEHVYIDAVGKNGTNRVRIDSNGVKVESASCPNGECVAMDYLHSMYLPIVCLPNNLVIRYVGGSSGETEPEVDAVSK